MPALARDQELELTIDSLAYGGRGVARHGELVVFVARALPGDRVRARVTKFKRRYAEARAVELLEPGPGRVTPRCAHFGVCGGCAWQDLEYAEQLRHKQAQVVDALQRLGRLEGYELAPIEPARQIWGYRNKLEYSWSQTADGPSLGFHVAGRWDRLMAVEHLPHRIAGLERAAPRRSSGGRESRACRRTTSAPAPASCATWWCARAAARASCWRCWSPRPARRRAVDRPAAMLPEGVVGVVHAVNDGVAEVTAGLAHTTLFGVRRVRGADRRADAAPLGRRLHADQQRDVRGAVRPRHRAGAAAPRLTSPGTSTAAPARSACWRRRTSSG